MDALDIGRRNVNPSMPQGMPIMEKLPYFNSTILKCEILIVRFLQLK